jgi:uncharacterized protein YjbJ (UPF0337 family)
VPPVSRFRAAVKEARMINKDEAAGKAEQVKGTVKDKVGEWTGDAELEAEGEVDQLTGKIREKAGTAERKVEETVDEIKRNVNR